MKAKVTTPFPGRPDGEGDVRELPEGEIITGDLAAVAVREGWAEEVTSDDDVVDTETVDLDKMKKADLLAYAEARSIDLGEARTNAEMVAAIRAAEAAADNPSGA